MQIFDASYLHELLHFQFAAQALVPFLEADYARDYNWHDGTFPEGKGDYPVGWWIGTMPQRTPRGPANACP